MKVEFTQRIRDISLSSIRKSHACHGTPKTRRHATFCTLRWINSPIPIRQTDFISNFPCLLSSVSRRELIRNLNCPIMQNLLKQRKIRPMPRPKEVASMSAIPIIAPTLSAIPRYKRCAMDTYPILVVSTESRIVSLPAIWKYDSLFDWSMAWNLANAWMKRFHVSVSFSSSRNSSRGWMPVPWTPTTLK